MVTISNGKEVRHVTKGAYKTIYESKGYRIISDESSKVSKPVEKVAKDFAEEVNDTPTFDEKEWVDDLLEKPISQWSKEEVTSFVKEKNIDTSSAHKLSEVKDIIKKWIEEQSK